MSADDSAATCRHEDSGGAEEAVGEEISGSQRFDQDRSGLAAFFEAMHIAAPFRWASRGCEILRCRGGSLSPGKMGRSVLRPYKGGRPD